MVAVKRPAVIEHPGVAVLKVLDVQQKLVFRFLLISLVVQNSAHVRQKQNAHKHRIRPEFLTVDRVGRCVLKTALLRSGKMLQHPIRAQPAGRKVPLLSCILRQKGQRKHGRERVDVQRRKPDLQLPVKIRLQQHQGFRVFSADKQFPKAEQSDSLRPLPAFIALYVVAAEIAGLHILHERRVVHIQIIRQAARQ